MARRCDSLIITHDKMCLIKIIPGPDRTDVRGMRRLKDLSIYSPAATHGVDDERWTGCGCAGI